jgi:RNA-splicing ligase RtcB
VERGFSQIGTLGSGNHYLEIQRVKAGNIFNKKLAEKWGGIPIHFRRDDALSGVMDLGHILA